MTNVPILAFDLSLMMVGTIIGSVPCGDPGTFRPSGMLGAYWGIETMLRLDSDQRRGRHHAHRRLCLLLALIRPLSVLGGEDLLQDPVPSAPSRTIPASPTDLQPSPRLPLLEPSDLGTNLPTPTDESEIRYDGKPTQGSRITIALKSSDDPTASYRWIQTEGPRVDIGDSNKPRITLTIPRGAERLGFVLLLRDRQGERRVRVTVPIGAEVVTDTRSPRADAGDDQIGLVGRTLSLNGSRSSVPANKPGSYRWIQVSGPKIAQPAQDKQFFSFIPLSPGVYRFILVVSENDMISEPDEVVVTVGELPSSSDISLRPPERSVGSDPTIGGTAGPAGKALAERVAVVFDQVADRADVYTSFEHITSEMTRGLDAIIPRDSPSRLIWSEGIFLPLSRRIEADLLAVGLDLRMPYSQQQTLTPAQKEAIRRFFRAYAQEFRSVAHPR